MHMIELKGENKLSHVTQYRRDHTNLVGCIEGRRPGAHKARARALKLVSPYFIANRTQPDPSMKL